MRLSIIIVNYKSADFILDCLQSAAVFESFHQFEWIVIDNDSKDDSKQKITTQFPSVRWESMGYNAGFARANNQGIKLATGNILLLLNPDTLVIKDAINDALIKFVASNFVACGVQMLNLDGSTQISGSNFMKGGINHLLPLPYYGNFLKIVSSLWGVKKPSIEVASPIEKVDWISGAFLMVKKEAVVKAGWMDEDFFLYAEEVEWCSRLNKIGPLCIFGEINIIHIMGEIISSNSKSEDKSYSNLFDKKGLQLILSNHLRIRKQYGIFWFLFQLLNYTIAIPFFLIASILTQSIKFNNPFSEINKIIGLAKNVIQLWKYAPTIIINQPHFYKVL